MTGHIVGNPSRKDERMKAMPKLTIEIVSDIV
jgi:hypothetical protein